MVNTTRSHRSILDGEFVFDFINSCILIILIVSTLYPFWQEMVISISTNKDALAQGIHLFPIDGFQFGAYKNILKSNYLWIGFGNTIFRTVFGTAFSLILTAVTAYPLSKGNMPFKRFFTSVVIFTMVFNGGLIPNYILINSLNLIDNRLVLVLSGALGGFNIIIMRNFFMGIPLSLEESAKIDGARLMTVFLKIVLPLSKPVLATIALWMAVYHWNAWFDVLLYIRNPEKQVLQIVLRKILLQIDSSSNMVKSFFSNQSAGNIYSTRQVKATLVVIATIPIVAIYPFAQKFFIKGIALGALKG